MSITPKTSTHEAAECCNRIKEGVKALTGLVNELVSQQVGHQAAPSSSRSEPSFLRRSSR